MEKKRHIFRMDDYQVGDNVSVFWMDGYLDSAAIDEIRVKGNVIRIIFKADPKTWGKDKVEFIGDRRVPLISNEYCMIAIPSYVEKFKSLHKRAAMYDKLHSVVCDIKELFKSLNEE